MDVNNIKNVKIEDIFCKDGLYIKYSTEEFNRETFVKVMHIFNKVIKVNLYCMNCEEDRLFVSNETKTKIIPSNQTIESAFSDVVNYNKDFSRKFSCSYCENDRVIFNFRIEDDYLIKVGQFPSLADLTRADTKKYRNILSKDDYSDLNRAIGLHSHGVGAGSLIYLRRIFENLIRKAYDESIREDKWDKELDFNSIKMEEKIKNLEGHLPRFVLEHHYIYGILSKGIHELSEQECRDYFDILRESIFIILDEEIKRVEEKERISTASKALNKINSMLGVNK